MRRLVIVLSVICMVGCGYKGALYRDSVAIIGSELFKIV